MTPEISVVIPLRDEERNVVPLHDELTRVLKGLGREYEVILVDDGSEDATFARLSEVQARDRRVRVVQFTRNFGQTAAFAAGFARARGEFIVTSDGDLQNDPADIPKLLALARDHDVVCGWRKDRKDSFVTRHLPSIVANRLLGAITGLRLHDNGCSLKVYRANVVQPLKLRPGMHRYLPALAGEFVASVLGRTPRVTEVVVNHRPRQFGRSKYGLSRTFSVARDLVGLRQLMRDASDPDAPAPVLYEVRRVLESV
ncbi:MAG: glycosyltransferase family 2 protein [Acidimicrobiia bacterium]|nr:glycosyltransferase family 2 protein [Acidimicrobiia bacterium]